MPRVQNFTVFPNFRYYSWDTAKREFGVVIVKATYEIGADGTLAIAEEQAPMMFTDSCHGEVNKTALWHPSDMVPVKPHGDIIVNAVAHAPGGVPARDWLCGLRVEGRTHRLEKLLRVTGPRQWVPEWRPELREGEVAQWRDHRRRFKGWTLTAPEPAVSVPIRHELAYGGLLPMGIDDAGAPIVRANHYNPLGRGWIDPEWTDHTSPVLAPQIEAAGHPVVEPHEALPPQGLGPIPPAWLPRRPLGGTYDQAWKDEVWPGWPIDYDFAYHNSAHPDLHWPGFFDGMERLTLLNLIPGQERATICLPGSMVQAKLIRTDRTSERQVMNLDTIFLDIAAPDPADHRVYLSWRLRFEADTFTGIELSRVPAGLARIAEGEAA